MEEDNSTMATALQPAATHQHWTQTAEGRERMRKIGKRRWKQHRKKSQKARKQIARASRAKHWSQTARGRALIRESNKRRSRSHTTQARRSHVHVSTHPQVDDATFSYALGHVECWIQAFAASAAVPAEALATRLGEVLSGKVRR